MEPGTILTVVAPFFSDLDANPRHLTVADVPRPLGVSSYSSPVTASSAYRGRIVRVVRFQELEVNGACSTESDADHLERRQRRKVVVLG